MMTTNAIYLREYLDLILKYNFLLTISLDGDEENDAYRSFPNRKPSFEIVYDTLNISKIIILIILEIVYVSILLYTT